MLEDKDIEKLSEVFATKKDLENLIDIVVTKEDAKNFATKNDLTKFKDEILTGHDAILTKLDILLTEKPIGDEQDKRQKKVLEIHSNALRKSKILSDEQVSEIDKLRVF